MPAPVKEYRSFKDPAVIASFAATIAVLACVWWAPQGDGSDVVVVAAPWSGKATAAEVVLNAGGRIISSGRWPFIIVARPDAGPATAFQTRLYRTGALAVLDARLFAGCVTETSK